jgi:ATP-dependent DNA helicase RecG
MNLIRIFISSVQREFAQERAALRDYLRGDPLMRRFFDVFLFEDVPALDRRPDSLYLDEVRQSDLYVGLFGSDYGSEDADGISPTEREFDQATASGVHRLIFVKGTDDSGRQPKMQTLIRKAQAGLIRKRFDTSEELVTALYAALVEYLDSKDLVRSEPFDAAPCSKASLDALDTEQMRWFIRTARSARAFPLTEGASIEELLVHLNLLNDGKPTNAAMLLFGKSPQRSLLSSEVRCAHFHGTEVAKPIPSYQVYKGTAFQLVDQAVDFVLSKIALSVGTRAESVQAPVAYEIPKEVVTEAIVNAVAHRDYTSNASVQVMLFSDRLEVWNPGRLPHPLTLEQLRDTHPSVPNNRLLARSLYLTRYIEEMGTGTLDMIRRCRDAGLPEPEFTDSSGFKTTIWRAIPPEQIKVQPASLPGDLKSRVLNLLADGPMSKSELSKKLGHREVSGQLNKVVRDLLADRMIEYTLPEKPTSPRQQYRLTDKGRTELANLKSEKTG